MKPDLGGATSAGATATAGTTAMAASAGLGADVIVTIVLGVATIVMTIALAAWNIVKQQKETRRQERARLYADALRLVGDYQEAPYRIRRRDGSATARRELTESISEIKSRIDFYIGWMSINAPEAVTEAYEAYVLAAQQEAGGQMTAAWQGRPTKRDQDVPLARPLPRTHAAPYREVVLAAIKDDLAN